MHTQPKRTESKIAAAAPGSTKHKVPDPPDPDNLPIDYPGTGVDPRISASPFPRDRQSRLRPQSHS
ncbi:hypothetical protein SB659_09075 [Arthrobacter sp. SIMBA_036]|uniref:hypothetical protein n=1 Tax=Arthrobacter sp. SIMBA_036 TaxID=3085778 RepID=UPI00397BB452